MCAEFQNEILSGYDFLWHQIFHFPIPWALRHAVLVCCLW